MHRKTKANLVLAAGLALATQPAARAQVEIDSYTFGGLEARSIGPAVMSGRISAIAAVPEDPLTIYVGAASGGVWTSKDGGITWKPIFDEHIQSIGAIAIDPQNSKNLWVGTGESCTRNSVSVGDGLYKSTDGGESWQRVGLEDSERIAAVRVHPKDSNTVWACATGHLWNSNEQRGVYKTTDGGKTWKKTLSVDDETGCSDLDVDPQDPSILYAGMWQFRRQPWTFNSGGKGSGLYKSTDGGETWRPLTKGLPEGEKGRIAVAVAPSRASVIYALVEAKKTALYRSDDVGESWREVNSSFNIQARPFYFSHLEVDPTDFNTVYKPGLTLTVSTDGGKSFNNSMFSGFGGGVHSDHHALWINPNNPHELILGTDGGVYMSYDKGNKWRHVKALPVSQFYRISYDMEWPYNVYGGLQDNGSWAGPSRGTAGIQNRHWRNIGMGDGFYAFRAPDDPDLVFVEYQGGEISRLRLSTGENKQIKPLPGKGEPSYRFNWNTPIHLSASEPGTMYLGSQFLFRSRDHGDSWEKISPDLTTNDPKKQEQEKSGGLSPDNTTAENHTTIYAIAESPKNARVIWVGTDDGNVQMTRDGGKTWTNVVGNVPGVPKFTWVSGVEASPHDEATAFVTFDGHALGDMKTYVYKTADFGATWTQLGGDTLKDAGYAHVVRQDPANPDLLFVGTELGLYVSVDGGARWARFTGKLPRVAVRDLAIHPRESDLIVATHGRGVFIVDDITPLRKLTREALEADVVMLDARPSPMVIPAAVQDFPGDDEFVGLNPEEAGIITYYLKKRHVIGDLKVEVFDDKGEKIADLPSGKRRGINRVAWPMRLKAPKVPVSESMVLPFAFFGPRVPAGTYTVKLTQGEKTYSQQIQLVPDPRSKHTAEDRALQQQTAMTLYEMLGRLAYISDSAVSIKDQAAKRAEALPKGDRLRGRLEALVKTVESFAGTLAVQGEGGGVFAASDDLLRERLGALYGGVNGYEGRPSKSQLDQVTVLQAEIDEAAAKLESIQTGDLAAVNRELEKRKLEPIRVKTREEWEKEEGKRAAVLPAWVPVARPFF
ncbi:MAG TPA: glycosyl hydrolase [Thermoanaerobaculia bacterium]|nr:glycosyl hydrolase [Thermoanaerobaculia bacterium]